MAISLGYVSINISCDYGNTIDHRLPGNFCFHDSEDRRKFENIYDNSMCGTGCVSENGTKSLVDSTTDENRQRKIRIYTATAAIVDSINTQRWFSMKYVWSVEPNIDL